MTDWSRTGIIELMTNEFNPTKNVTLSPQQIAAREFLLDPTSGNMMIEAVAGSGKTFTLIELLKVLGNVSVAFCAFSKNISVEIKEKVEAIRDTLTCDPRVGTTHSFGFSALKRVFHGKLDDEGKINRLLEETKNPKTGETGVPFEMRGFVRKAYRLSRQWGVGVLPAFPMGSAEAWMNLVDHFDLEDELCNQEEDPENLEDLVRSAINWTVYVLKMGEAIANELIDFEDMIWLVLRKNIRVWQYDVVLVDECQDINPTKRALVRKMLRPGGRAIFVGDPRQAIFAFIGADHKSIENINAEFGCTTLPLTYSFRCPKSVVRFAKTWVNHIESTPDAPEGTCRTITTDEFWQFNFRVNDAILCRNNAPLVDLFFSLLRKGIPSHIEGKDIAADLLKTVNRFKVKSIPTLINKLETFKDKQIQKWSMKGKEEKAERVADIVDAIVAIANNLPDTATVPDLKAKITSMFQDSFGNRAQTLTLTTIHKAKGREWDRVFWYGRNRWNPSPYARKDWQKIAEDNLCYVAATRSKDELYDVIVIAAKGRKPKMYSTADGETLMIESLAS